jgi:hypothetical protein
VNFGALTGFLALHISVVVWFMVRQRSRRWFTHLIAPLLGFAIIGYVLLNTQTNAKIVGVAWLGVGVIVLLVIKARGGDAGLLAKEDT